MDTKVMTEEARAKAQFLADNLKSGEHYAGLVLGKNGDPDYHLVVVCITEKGVPWVAQTAWAQSVGGELPNRRELNLLRANLRELFAPAWYWSCETYEGDSAYAWCQYFGDGRQNDGGHKSAALRAVAVRRINF